MQGFLMMSQSLLLSPTVVARLPLLRQQAKSLKISFGPVAFFFVAHIAIAPLLRRVAALLMLHVAIVVALGLWWALTERKNLVRVAYIGAYITGAEVLWRMAQAPLPWEFGKYAVTLLFFVAILRHQLFKIPLLPLLFFVPLTFSIPLTISYAYQGYARSIISFYMSGPLALFCCAWFFSHIKLSRGQLQRVLIALIAPVLSIGAIALFSSLMTETISFGTESNRITSGDFAPNQVSAVLGLGAFLSLLFVLGGHLPHRLKLLLFGAVIFLGTQSALTFSRGGLFMAGGATIGAFFYLSRNRQLLISSALVCAILFVIANYVVLPRLETFTDGAITKRFLKTDTTGRDQLIVGELELFIENPILGVGPGMGGYYRIPLGVGSHTEYSRLLSEHGVFGLTAILILLVSVWKNLRKERSHLSKAVVLSFSLWSLLFMVSAAMRLVAPAFMFGICFAALLPSEVSRIQVFLRRLKRLKKLTHQSAI